MNPLPVDADAIGQRKAAESRASVRNASEKKVKAREASLKSELKDSQGLQLLAADMRQAVLDDLGHWLEVAEENLQARGFRVHWADDAEEARRLIGDICQAAGGGLISKAKSMVTEEIELNAHLEKLGYTPVETDLGEFVVQIAHDHPSHIVTPIIHINGKQVARLFAEHKLGEYTEDPAALTRMARAHLRRVYREAGIGITGANFVVAETGRLVTVSNEGNLRLSSNAPRVHIAITGIEKIAAREAEMAVLLKLLARSATGQSLTVYTQFFGGPRRGDEPDGPEESHIIFLNNGRTNLLGGKYREMLRCIRCGACLNVCPVYRAVTGHGYDSVYPGPMGAILSPLLGGDEGRRKYAWLPKASSLCGACEEVCPVAIPIPKMLVGLRQDLRKEAPSPKGTPPFGPWAMLATNSRLWRVVLAAGRAVGWGPTRIAPISAFANWTKHRSLPPWPKRSFRHLWKQRNRHRD